MNKDEMSKEMQKDLVLSEQDCVWLYEKEGYRKLADDEIVIKKDEYEELSKDYATINNEAYYCGMNVGKQETASEILQELYYEATSNVSEIVELTAFQIEQLAKAYGIELED